MRARPHHVAHDPRRERGRRRSRCGRPRPERRRRRRSCRRRPLRPGARRPSGRLDGQFHHLAAGSLPSMAADQADAAGVVLLEADIVAAVGLQQALTVAFDSGRGPSSKVIGVTRRGSGCRRWRAAMSVAVDRPRRCRCPSRMAQTTSARAADDVAGGEDARDRASWHWCAHVGLRTVPQSGHGEVRNCRTGGGQVLGIEAQGLDHQVGGDSSKSAPSISSGSTWPATVRRPGRAQAAYALDPHAGQRRAAHPPSHAAWARPAIRRPRPLPRRWPLPVSLTRACWRGRVGRGR